MKAILCGGGTGGHIYPALSIANQFRADGVGILYMGTEDSLEAKLASENGFAFFAIPATGLHRRSVRLVKDLTVNYSGLRMAKKIIKDFAPDIAIGTGGYASAPVIKAAQQIGIPTLIHEQNVFPGLSNRMLAKGATAVCLTFAAAEAYFPEKAKMHLTGLPIRREILTVSQEDALEFFGLSPLDKTKTLLITGGSQGATSLNNAFEGCCSKLLDLGYRVIHLCGERDYSRLKQTLPERPNLILRPYLEKIEYALALADLAFSRAGASFLAEAAAVGLPLILSPYPHAANDHQSFNAHAFVESDAAIVIPDSELSPDILLTTVQLLLEDSAQLRSMSKQSQNLAQPEAAKKIAEIAYGLLA